MKKGVYIHYAILSNLKTFYATYILIFVAYPFLITLFLLLESKRVLLHDLGVAQGSDDTGIAEKKYMFRVELVDKFQEVAEPMAALYKNRKDMENYRKMKFWRSNLIKARPEKLLQVVDGVIVYCGDNTADCTEAGNTTAKIATLQTARDNFAPYANLSNTTKKLKKGVTAKINAIDVEVGDILNNQLDGAMKAIKDLHPAAYAEYLLIVEPIREGVHSHNTIVAKAPFRLTAVHDVTGEPVADAPLKISGVKGTFTTDANGIILANLPLGAYVGKIAFIDFVAQSFSFTLTADGIVLIIRLVPVGV